jgi:two-component sensor histidine kinase
MTEAVATGAPETLAQAIVNTLPEPFLVLDHAFRVQAASRSFCTFFQVDPQEMRNSLLFALGDGQWDIPALRLLLETIIPDRTSMEDFEVEHDFPRIGRRTMLLDARKVLRDDDLNPTILLAFRDITVRRAIEREKEELLSRTEELLRQKNLLLEEMQHRVSNSLQIIASILLLKARGVNSEETRQHLHDAHQRVMSVAEVQRHLHVADGIDQIEVSSYLSKLCASLAGSMIAQSETIDVKVVADSGQIASSAAVSLGLIVTELLINAIKYAFPYPKTDAGVLITYEIAGTDWMLTVSDNGKGKDTEGTAAPASGLGTAIVAALVKQLDAQLEVVSSPAGTAISVTRATFTSRLPKAA